MSWAVGSQWLYHCERRWAAKETKPNARFGGGGGFGVPNFFGVATPAEPRGKKKKVLPSVLKLLLGAGKTMTATDVTGFDAIFSTGFFATFSPDFGGLVLLN